MEWVTVHCQWLIDNEWSRVLWWLATYQRFDSAPLYSSNYQSHREFHRVRLCLIANCKLCTLIPLDTIREEDKTDAIVYKRKAPGSRKRTSDHQNGQLVKVRICSRKRHLSVSHSALSVAMWAMNAASPTRRAMDTSHCLWSIRANVLKQKSDTMTSWQMRASNY